MPLAASSSPGRRARRPSGVPRGGTIAAVLVAAFAAAGCGGDGAGIEDGTPEAFRAQQAPPPAGGPAPGAPGAPAPAPRTD